MSKTAMTPTCQVCDGLRELTETPAGYYCKEDMPMDMTKDAGYFKRAPIYDKEGTQMGQQGHWYVAETGNHQGLIIDEATGENIAISYKKEDAPLLAAVPELLEALKVARDVMYEEGYRGGNNPLMRKVEDALKLAEGRENG